jgi:hypothetical protein
LAVPTRTAEGQDPISIGLTKGLRISTRTPSLKSERPAAFGTFRERRTLCESLLTQLARLRA